MLCLEVSLSKFKHNFNAISISNSLSLHLERDFQALQPLSP